MLFRRRRHSTRRPEPQLPTRFKRLPDRQCIVGVTYYPGPRFLLVRDARRVKRYGGEATRNWWQFPQGGLQQADSDHLAAGVRELYEELYHSMPRDGPVCVHGMSSVTYRNEWREQRIREWIGEHKKDPCASDRCGYKGQANRFLMVELDPSVPLRINTEELEPETRLASLEEIFAFSRETRPERTDNPVFLSYRGLIPEILGEFPHLFPGRLGPMLEEYRRTRGKHRAGDTSVILSAIPPSG